MKHIVLGANGRIAKELILRLTLLGIAPIKVSSKLPESIEEIAKIPEEKKLVIYDFMSASRPRYEGCSTFEDDTRAKILAYGSERIFKYVYVSSAGELYKGNGMIRSLEDIVNSRLISKYAKRKLEVEKTIVNRFKIAAKVLRVTNVYGGHFKSKGLGVVDNWLDDKKSGHRPQITAEIDTYRNYIHVDFVIDEIMSDDRIGSTIVLDTNDYFYLSEIYSMIFSQNVSFQKSENVFDLSNISFRRPAFLGNYIEKELK